MFKITSLGKPWSSNQNALLEITTNEDSNELKQDGKNTIRHYR